MPSRHLQPAHIPNYQRLCALTKEIPELDPDHVMLIVLIRAVADDLRASLHESLDRYSISEGRFRVLGHLFDRETPATHSELAHASGVTKGTVTGLIDGLERDGLVRRLQCPDDRRVSLIEMTPQGEKTFRSILPGHLTRLAELFGGLTKAEQRTMLKLLKKVRTELLERERESEEDGSAS